MVTCLTWFIVTAAATDDGSEFCQTVRQQFRSTVIQLRKPGPWPMPKQEHQFLSAEEAVQLRVLH